jgi:hypothetical protein
MNLFVSLYLAALFVALTPGILLTLPKGGKKLTVAVVHGLVFAFVYYLTHKMVWRATYTMDGFQGKIDGELLAELKKQKDARVAAEAETAAARAREAAERARQDAEREKAAAAAAWKAAKENRERPGRPGPSWLR